MIHRFPYAVLPFLLQDSIPKHSQPPYPILPTGKRTKYIDLHWGNASVEQNIHNWLISMWTV